MLEKAPEATPERARDTEDGTGPAVPPATGEIAVLTGVQHAIANPTTVKIARGMSHFGEHSLGWFALGVTAAVVDGKRRRDWLTAAAGVVGAHAASIGIKRVVRRPRPEHPGIRVGVGTPSRLSFPSSHATSTTAAAVLYSGMTGRNLVPALVPPMLASRLVLGVHYPTDVLAGAALGGFVGGLLRRRLPSRKRRSRPAKEAG